MHFIRLLLLLLPQLVALSKAQNSSGLRLFQEVSSIPPLVYINGPIRNMNSTEETTKSALTTRYTTKAATTNIFDKFLTKSSHTTRSSVENSTSVGSTIKPSTQGLWLLNTTVNKATTTLKTPSTTTKRSHQSTYFNILTKYTTIPTAPTKTTEMSAAATNTTMIIPTTTSTTAKTTTKATTSQTTATIKTPSTTATSITSSTANHHQHHHLMHADHNSGTTTTKSGLELTSSGCTNLKLHFSMSLVVLIVLGSYQIITESIGKL
ncbi:hypothetical protein KR044_004649 [Drosophila immigrans]|nr:hypothetical protein KR044_004649 [Drosophila immigrans]